jgi:hypothetical protein
MQNVLHVIGEILALCVGIAWIAMFVIFVLCLWYGEWMLAFIAFWLMALFGAWHKHNEAERGRAVAPLPVAPVHRKEGLP